jgi:DNA-binding beta-propeller fold protein YncE
MNNKHAQSVVLSIAGISLAALSALYPSPLASRPQSAAGKSGYKLLREVPIDAKGGWDYLMIDPEGRRLYISNDSGIIVFDVDAEKVVGNVPQTPWVPGRGFVHGVAIARDLNRGFISHEAPPAAVIFDLKTLAILGEAKSDPGPDAIVYDATSKRVFVFNSKDENVHDVTAIDAATGKPLGSIQLAAGPEFAVADGAGHVYVNIEDKSELDQIDSKTLKVTASWPTAPCEGPSGLAIDIAHRRLFATCHNNVMAMVNADTGKVVGTVPIGAGTDAARFDPGTGFAFSSNGSGTLTVAHEDSPDKLTLVENVKTLPSARTMEVDPKTHRVYMMSAKTTPAPKEPAPATPDNPHRYAKVVPGTAKLLILGIS